MPLPLLVALPGPGSASEQTQQHGVGYCHCVVRLKSANGLAAHKVWLLQGAMLMNDGALFRLTEMSVKPKYWMTALSGTS